METLWRGHWAPSDGQGSSVVTTSPGDNVRKQRPQQTPRDKCERTLLSGDQPAGPITAPRGTPVLAVLIPRLHPTESLYSVCTCVHMRAYVCVRLWVSGTEHSRVCALLEPDLSRHGHRQAILFHLVFSLSWHQNL